MTGGGVEGPLGPRSRRSCRRGVWLAAVAWQFLAVTASAQLGAAIAPARIEALVGPGARTTEVLSFSNTSATALSVSVEVVDFDVAVDNGVLEKPSGTSPDTLAPYLRVTPLIAEVAPGQQVFFRCSLRAPAEFAQLRAMIYFVAHPHVEDTGGTKVVIVPRLGIPAYLQNPKARAGTLEVRSVSLQRATGSGEAVELDLDVVNTGERNIRPNGYLRVRATDGSFDRAFAFNEGGEPVLPAHQRKWRMTFGPVPGGELSLRLRFTTSRNASHQSDHTIAAASPPSL